MFRIVHFSQDTPTNQHFEDKMQPEGTQTFGRNLKYFLWPFFTALFTVTGSPNYGKRKSGRAESHIPSLSWFYDRRAAGREAVGNETRRHISKLTLIYYSKCIIYEKEEQIAHVRTSTHAAILMTQQWHNSGQKCSCVGFQCRG